MRIRSSCRIDRTLRSEQGTFTLEAALLLPISVAVLVALVFALIAVAQSSLVYITAGESAERVAEHWNRSTKHPETGMYSPLEREPLYWRWLYDGAEQWFGPAGGGESVRIEYPGEADGSNDESVVKRKLASGVFGWPSAYRGAAAYENGGLLHSVTVSAAVPLSLPAGLGLPDQATGVSTDSVNDPAEYIRNIELTLGYIPRLDVKVEVGTLRNTLSPWLDRRGIVPVKDRELTFGHHAQAAIYLRTLINGAERRISTQETGKWRKIDSMDKHGVAHQVYIGPKTTTRDVRDQLMKDAELLRKGKVSGVAWHFFRRTGETTAGPSPALKQLLQSHGIIVVIHY
ncbi:hypothetical protein [Paenibacillus sp.]|uniref:TadE/TadG family type IV pilus assembly protein n=1 Tax=Paenibacillus sp. TaxID=58172 RepID=UPI002D73348C|nr:hypothetical protein [Paenibacillus sp.]HZG88515.1 hypothetical protein [Paenibacillus sp.]